MARVRNVQVRKAVADFTSLARQVSAYICLLRWFCLILTELLTSLHEKPPKPNLQKITPVKVIDPADVANVQQPPQVSSVSAPLLVLCTLDRRGRVPEKLSTDKHAGSLSDPQ